MTLRIKGLIILTFFGLAAVAQGDVDNIPIHRPQIETPFYCFYKNCVNGKIKTDSLGSYYISKEDTNRIVFFGKDWHMYKVFNKNYQLIVDGDLGGLSLHEQLFRQGRWTEYFENGKAKTIGYFFKNEAVGLWQFFYPNGLLEESYTIAYIHCNDTMTGYCMVGSYDLYYKNGQKKINGLFLSYVDTAIANIDSIYIDQIKDHKLKYLSYTFKPKKMGSWYYYYENGKLKKEDFWSNYIY